MILVIQSYPTKMTFRSLEMNQYQMIIPKDSAYLTLNLLGYEDALHFIDIGDPSDRHFTQFIKRCDECLFKISIIQQALHKINIDFDQYEEGESLFVERLRENWKEEAKMEGVEQAKLIDIYEDRVSNNYKSFLNFTDRLEKLKENLNKILERIACLQAVKDFFGDSHLKMQSQEYYVNNTSFANQIQNVSFLVGVIDYQTEAKLSKTIYRVSKGYACTRTLQKFAFYGLKKFNKKVILIIYPTSEQQILQRRLQKVMDVFCQKSYSVNEFQYTGNQNYDQAIKSYNEVTNLVEMEQKRYKEFMNQMRSMFSIETFRIFFWKERALYEYLNKLDRREQFYIANVYIPKKLIKSISIQINRIVPTPTLHEIPIDNPPTAFDTNTYTSIPQQITDTYGIPRYREVNPSIFTTVTFPFFFGVMFGDIAHGIMIFALGLYLIVNRDSFRSGVFQIFANLRYMIAMMGFFAVYCGFIYNDLAGFNYNFFGSCYNPPLNPSTTISVHPKPDCVYPFGIDPVWGRAQNQLVFVNSLKMKISVIIAIIHMSVGVCVKAANSLYFRKKVDFYFQFIPQLIFLVGLFGYMDFLIIFKWLKVWNERSQGVPPTQWAPSIIATMMNIGLGFGKTSQLPDGNSNMWGERGNSSQDPIQMMILVVALICIPWMLVPKPLLEIRSHRKIKQKKQVNPLEKEHEQFLQQSRNALEERLNPNGSLSSQIGDQVRLHEESSEIIVHQLIETIEFVLGCVSNTASYLRLWALSLAHSQLSKVFFTQTAGRFFGNENIVAEILSLFVGTWMVMWITFGIILCMDSMQCFLHSLRLHWVEFQSKFYKGDGYKYTPFSFKSEILLKKQANSQ